MNYLYCIFFGVIIYSVVVGARHHGERPAGEIEQDDYSVDSDEHSHKHAKDRHRRKRFQPYHPYHYPVPQSQFYYPERREDNTDLFRIVRLLEEIAENVRRPSPPLAQPPQIFYVPYGFPITPKCKCPNSNKSDTGTPDIPVNFPTRIKPDIEENQNWGFVDQNSGKSNGQDNDYEDDFSRPISFKPVQRPQHALRPQPKVDHGSTQAGEASTKMPSFEPQGREPSGLDANCNGALIYCCMDTDKQRQFMCLTQLNCAQMYANGAACQRQNILKLLNLQTYKLSQN